MKCNPWLCHKLTAFQLTFFSSMRIDATILGGPLTTPKVSSMRIDATILGGPLTTPKGMAVHCFPSIAPARKLGPDCYSSCSSPKLSSLVAKRRPPAVNFAHNTKCTKCHNTHKHTELIRCPPRRGPSRTLFCTTYGT